MQNACAITKHKGWNNNVETIVDVQITCLISNVQQTYSQLYPQPSV